MTEYIYKILENESSNLIIGVGGTEGRVAATVGGSLGRVMELF